MKNLYNLFEGLNTVSIQEGLFDVDSSVGKAVEVGKYNLDWIKNRDLRRHIEANFYTTPENLKRDGIDLKDLPIALQILELLNSMNGDNLRSKIKTYVEYYVEECRRTIRSYEFVNEFAPIITILDKNLTKLSKLIGVDFLKKKEVMNFLFKEDCKEQMDQIFQDKIKKLFQIEFVNINPDRWLLLVKKL